jgi:hypothetical protein
MVEPPTPVDGDIGLLVHEKIGGIDGPATTQLTEFVESCKAGTVTSLIDVELSFLFGTIDLVGSFLLRLEHLVIGIHKAFRSENVLTDKVLEIINVFGVMEFE